MLYISVGAMSQHWRCDGWQINTNEKPRVPLINKSECPERITLQPWEDKSKGGCEAAATQLQGEISYLINHCILLFLQGSQYLFLLPARMEEQRNHLSHTPSAISLTLLILSQPLSFTLFLSLALSI